MYIYQHVCASHSASPPPRKTKRHSVSFNSSLHTTRRKKISRWNLRSSIKDSENRETCCFSGNGGTIAPGRSLCNLSYNHAKSEYRRLTDVAYGKSALLLLLPLLLIPPASPLAVGNGGSYATEYMVYLPLIPSLYSVGSETVMYATESSACTRKRGCIVVCLEGSLLLLGDSCCSLLLSSLLPFTTASPLVGVGDSSVLIVPNVWCTYRCQWEICWYKQRSYQCRRAGGRLLNAKQEVNIMKWLGLQQWGSGSSPMHRRNIIYSRASLWCLYVRDARRSHLGSPNRAL